MWQIVLIRKARMRATSVQKQKISQPIYVETGYQVGRYQFSRSYRQHLVIRNMISLLLVSFDVVGHRLMLGLTFWSLGIHGLLFQNLQKLLSARQVVYQIVPSPKGQQRSSWFKRWAIFTIDGVDDLDEIKPLKMAISKFRNYIAMFPLCDRVVLHLIREALTARLLFMWQTVWSQCFQSVCQTDRSQSSVDRKQFRPSLPWKWTNTVVVNANHYTDKVIKTSFLYDSIVLSRHPWLATWKRQEARKLFLYRTCIGLHERLESMREKRGALNFDTSEVWRFCR